MKGLLLFLVIMTCISVGIVGLVSLVDTKATPVEKGLRNIQTAILGLTLIIGVGFLHIKEKSKP